VARRIGAGIRRSPPPCADKLGDPDRRGDCRDVSNAGRRARRAIRGRCGRLRLAAAGADVCRLPAVGGGEGAQRFRPPGASGRPWVWRAGGDGNGRRPPINLEGPDRAARTDHHARRAVRRELGDRSDARGRASSVKDVGADRDPAARQRHAGAGGLGRADRLPAGERDPLVVRSAIDPDDDRRHRRSDLCGPERQERSGRAPLSHGRRRVRAGA
jgi:hypothetical protein